MEGSRLPLARKSGIEIFIVSNYVMENVIQSFIGINKDFATKNPHIVKKFLKAMKKAYDYGEKNPAQIIISFLDIMALSINHLCR